MWIVSEDTEKVNPQTLDALNASGVKYRYLHGPSKMNLLQGKYRVKGASERNRALDFLVETYKNRDHSGVVYFADDDNTYDGRLFEEIRGMEGQAGFLPVGFVSKRKAIDFVHPMSLMN